ncbi:hypothetical protein [Salinibacter ruber]|uniref:hypothetical protein n=1 Tax=Salinibacter ruber TaxID=146919 RepID=UPI002168BF31|nr:hypothetical protein [Salinibacter ruber]
MSCISDWRRRGRRRPRQRWCHRASTQTVDQEGTMIGLEVLGASDVLQDNVQFEVELDLPARTTAGST